MKLILIILMCLLPAYASAQTPPEYEEYNILQSRYAKLDASCGGAHESPELAEECRSRGDLLSRMKKLRSTPEVDRLVMLDQGARQFDAVKTDCAREQYKPEADESMKYEIALLYPEGEAHRATYPDGFRNQSCPGLLAARLFQRI